ncbi:MAG: hypothetical protein L0287_23915, partial [Anaerolineae bacterium]|nr:hypothetical protein [Anaerolineae bacterium]
MITGKVWGTTEVLLRTPFIEVHRLSIVPYATCSLHYHNFKWNAFYVERGTLKIAVHKKDYPLVDVTVLGPRDFTIVKPGEKHLFFTEREACECIEIYYPESLSEDIIRSDVGG